MAYDDRYGGRDRYRGEWRDESRYDRGRDDREPRDERGFFERMGDWFAGSDYDDRDRNPGAHTDYYRGGDFPRQRYGSEGEFAAREDFRRSNRYAESGQAGYGREEDGYPRAEYRRAERSRGYARDGEGSGDSFSGGSGGGVGGYGYAGRTGANPTDSEFYGGSSYGGGSYGGSGGSTYSRLAREQAIVDQQRRQQQGRGRQGWGGERNQRDRSAERSTYDHDPHYSNWRRQQIDALDRDYDDYRRENASRFDNEFGSWRTTRQGQRQSMGRVTEHMEVVGSDNQHLGKVDKVAGDRIVLTKNDTAAGGHHHSIPVGWIDRVEDKVILNRTAEQAKAAWRDEETSRALFERPDSGSDGPHVLGRSFAGTYRDDR